MDFDQLLGPLGALVLALGGLGALARDHIQRDRRDREDARATLAYEREQKDAVQKRLEAFRVQSGEMTDVLRRAVELTERVLDERRGE